MDRMCVFCEGVFSPDTIVCPNCDEYKGLVSLNEGIEYLNLDPADYE